MVDTENNNEKRAKQFVTTLMFVEDSLIKHALLAALWAAGMYLVLGALTAGLWLVVISLALVLPRAQSVGLYLKEHPVSKPAQLLGLITASIWGIAPFLVWQAGHGEYDTLAIMMLGIGFLQVINKYRSSARPAIVVAAPYLLLIVWFLYESRMSSTIIISVLATFAYLATLGGFLFSGQKSKNAIIQYKLEQDNLVVQLKEAKAKAEQANNTKSGFLANMSHELRTPLNGILGLSDVLLGEQLTTSQHRKLSLIKDSGDTLLVLLNDILDISKIEADGVTIEEIDIDLHAFIQKSYGFWNPTARKKSIKLVYQKQKGLPDIVVGDPTRMRQCLNNLISNAIKFTSKNGEITVTITGQNIKDAYALSFSVEDNGIGMSPEGASKLFKPFSQAEGDTTRKYGGTGLGLVITRKLCRLMGGDVVVQSSLGHGSLFKMYIQAQVSETRDVILEESFQSEGALGDFVGKKLLVVEDNEINLEVLLLLLEPYKMNILVARNGQEALQILDVQHVDVVLMDLQMPVLGGIAATHKIRTSASNYHDVPIIAMTAKAMNGDRKRCLMAGMNDYISKPLSRSALTRAFNEVLIAPSVVPSASVRHSA